MPLWEPDLRGLPWVNVGIKDGGTGRGVAKADHMVDGVIGSRLNGDAAYQS